MMPGTKVIASLSQIQCESEDNEESKKETEQHYPTLGPCPNPQVRTSQTLRKKLNDYCLGLIEKFYLIMNTRPNM